jgi:hypothetical protein
MGILDADEMLMKAPFDTTTVNAYGRPVDRLVNAYGAADTFEP